MALCNPPSQPWLVVRHVAALQPRPAGGGGGSIHPILQLPISLSWGEKVGGMPQRLQADGHLGKEKGSASIS